MMRSNRLRAMLTAALIAAFSGTAAAQVGRVSGMVRDDSGQPIKGAMVTAENPNIGPTTYTATTDDKGRFTIIGLRAGQWRFAAVAPGHAGDIGQMAVRFGSPNPPITFTLRKNGPSPSAPLGNVVAKDLQAQLAAADMLFNQQKWDDAIAAYRAILAKTPALSVINLQIAAAYRQKKDYDNAIAAYTVLLGIDPENEKAKVGIATTNLEKGDPAAAEDVLLRAAETPAAGREMAGREILYNLGEMKLARNQTDEAAQWYQKAAAADPSWGKPRYKLGLIAMNAGDKGSAARFMHEVMTVDPISPEAALAKSALDQLNK
jgi:tetratricopeptide (TPR) repeat protein